MSNPNNYQQGRPRKLSDNRVLFGIAVGTLFFSLIVYAIVRINLLGLFDPVVGDSSRRKYDLKQPLLIDATGNREGWVFVYAGIDSERLTDDDFQVRKHAVIPANTDVVFRLHSTDVIYVFSAPELNAKEIAVPDLDFSVRTNVAKIGLYNLVMDPMCGFRLPPGEVMGTISVVAPEKFEYWANKQTKLK